MRMNNKGGKGQKRVKSKNQNALKLELRSSFGSLLRVFNLLIFPR